MYVMRGHTDTVTGLALSPDGSYVLSNAMDCTGVNCILKLDIVLSDSYNQLILNQPLGTIQACAYSTIMTNSF